VKKTEQKNEANSQERGDPKSFAEAYPLKGVYSQGVLLGVREG